MENLYDKAMLSGLKRAAKTGDYSELNEAVAAAERSHR